MFIIAGILLISCMVVPASAWQEKVFAPYVDTDLYPAQPLPDIQRASGVNYYTLAFITASSSGEPAWNGVIPMGDCHYLESANQVRSSGGDIIISFGGESGSELATIVSDETALQAKYQLVIDRYDATRIDFDIEGAAVSDRPSVDRRNKAIAGLQVANPGLLVSYTLPVEPDGLTEGGPYIIQSAKNHGVQLATVNIMTMDFGEYSAPDPAGKMAQYAIDSAESTKAQLQSIYPEKSASQVYAMIGITPMIGQNDVAAEVFTLDDARKLTAYAKEHGIGFISMWSLARDNGSGAGSHGASSTASGLVQEDYAFLRIFNALGVPSGTVTPRPVATTPIPSPSPTITASPSVQPWKADATYTAGNQVTYQGETYVAQGWTTNEIPLQAKVWKRITTIGSAPLPWWERFLSYAQKWLYL
jgi:chitinase